MENMIPEVDDDPNPLRISERDINWRINSIIECTHVGTWEWNIQTGETIFNERWAEIIGYTLEEISPVTIETWMKFSHPDDLKESEKLLEKHFNGDLEYYECEARMKHKNGSWIWVFDRGRVQERDQNGKPLLMFGTHTDINLRKQDEEKNRYQANLLENVSDAIIATDMQYNIQYWNKTAESQYGWKFSEVVGQPLDKFIVNGYLEDSLDIILQKIQKEGYWKGEVIQNRRDGSPISVVSSLSSIINNANQLAGYISVNRDISVSKQTEIELRLHSEILKNIAEGIILIRADDGIIVYTNSKLERMFGYDPEELVGKHISILNASTDDDPEETAREIIHQLRLHGVWTGEVLNIKKNRTIFWSHANVTAFEHPPYGKVWISIHQDISRRKMAEQTMTTSEEKYRSTLNASPDGILLLNITGVITEISEIGVQLLGANSRDELVGKDFLHFVPSDEQNTLKEIIEKTTNEGWTHNIELKIKKKNQSNFLGEISSTLMQGPDGTPVSFMIIIRDISYRRIKEDKQYHSDRMASIGEMASGMAHEINQPLNIISMVVDKLLFEAARTVTIDHDFLKNKSDKIFENVTRIRNIIDNLRAFSRSDNDYVSTSFNINTSIENAVSMILEQFKHLGINLNINLEKKIPQIIGNSNKFEQVILNLLTNAKDAVIEKKIHNNEYVEMQVGITSYMENQCLIVEVTDNGIGIKHEDVPHIMLPFYTTKDEGKGTGLGLSICYQIMKEMDGAIEISSNGSFGTMIKLIIDYQKKR